MRDGGQFVRLGPISAARTRSRCRGGTEPNQPNTINNSCADGTREPSTPTSPTIAWSVPVKRQLDSRRHNGNGHCDSLGLEPFTSGPLDLYYAANANSPSWVSDRDDHADGRWSANAFAERSRFPPAALQAVRAQFRYQGSASSCTSGSFNDHDDLIFAVN